MAYYNQLINQCTQTIKERKCGVDGLAIDIGVSYSSLRKLLHKEHLRQSTIDRITTYFEQAS